MPPLWFQSGPRSDGNEDVLHIPQSSIITGTSPSDCLVSYPRHSLGGSYPSTEVQSVYSIAPADWASQWSRRLMFNPRSRWTTDSNYGTWCLLAYHFKVISKVRVKGKWSNPGKGVAPFPHLGVVALVKGAFGPPSTTVGQLTYIYIYIYICVCVCIQFLFLKV